MYHGLVKMDFGGESRRPINTVCHIAHDPKCTNQFRNLCFKRIKQTLRKFNFLESPLCFLRNEEEIQEFIRHLPSESQNLLINKAIGERESILTQESVREMWQFWRDSLERRANLEHIYGKLDKQLRRFSLNLGLLFALESFLQSNATVLLTFEDDTTLETNFEDCLGSVLSWLPQNWDVFNFIVPPEERQRFKPNLRLEGTPICINYQTYSTAAVLWSRSGARKVLRRMVFEFKNFSIGDPNGDISIDSLICNLVMTPPFDGSQLFYTVSYLPTRNFQTFTFVPNYQSPATQHNHEPSTWQ